MIGITLGRYFFARYIQITFWFFTGVFALIFIINFTELSSRTADLKGYTVSWALAVSSLQVPMIMLQAVPFIGLVSGMATLISLNRKYELVVARAAGVSAWQFLTPVCLGALMFGLASLFVLNPIAAHGFSQAQALEAELRSGRSNDDDTVPWLKQRTAEGETIIGADHVTRRGLELVGATVLRLNTDGDISERLEAERVVLRNGHWRLHKVTRFVEGEMPEDIESMRIATNLAPEFVQERLARPESLSIFELPRKIAAARSFGLSANAFATHFHALVALPALLVAMTLIAATVSMRFARMGQSATIILGGILAGFLLYVVTVLVKAFGEAGFVPPMAAAWFPVLVAGFVGVTFLLYKEDG